MAIANNPDAYAYEINYNIDRLVRTLIPHLRSSGLKLSSPKQKDTLRIIIRMIFETQNQRPVFHVEGTELPLCWNSPKDLDKDYIKYEWGTLTIKESE
jgi:hypothetical protein